MKPYSAWPIFCVLLFLVGCVSHPIKNGPAPVVSTTTAWESDMLAYAQRYGALPADEQKKEYTLVMQAYTFNKSLSNRMKAALVLGLPASRQRDNTRAMALLDDVQRDSEAPQEMRSLASLLKEYIAERQKLEDNTAKLNQKLGEDQRRIDALQNKADLYQQKADNLQQKLDELKNIEKAITTRDQGRSK
jgi:predicted ribosome quality control (RQC) complex YloA/Tae2 family protein